jgi:inosine/xanthosine triphosphate pyrophosphatase family protein
MDQMVGIAACASEDAERAVAGVAVCRVCKSRNDRGAPFCTACVWALGVRREVCACGECRGRWFERTRGVS